MKVTTTDMGGETTRYCFNKNLLDSRLGRKELNENLLEDIIHGLNIIAIPKIFFSSQNTEIVLTLPTFFPNYAKCLPFILNSIH